MSWKTGRVRGWAALSCPSSAPSLDVFLGSDGTLGLITELGLKIRRALEAEVHLAVAFADMTALRKAAVGLAAGEASEPYRAVLENGSRSTSST